MQLILASYYAHPPTPAMVTSMDAPIIVDLVLWLVCAALFFFAVWAFNIEAWNRELALSIAAIPICLYALGDALARQSVMWLVVWSVELALYCYFAWRVVQRWRRRRTVR